MTALASKRLKKNTDWIFCSHMTTPWTNQCVRKFAHVPVPTTTRTAVPVHFRVCSTAARGLFLAVPTCADSGEKWHVGSLPWWGLQWSWGSCQTLVYCTISKICNPGVHFLSWPYVPGVRGSCFHLLEPLYMMQ